MSTEDFKRQAAAQALELVTSGMRLGLGTGSTAAIFVELLGERLKAEGLDVLCIPTSEATRKQAEALGIALSTLDDTPYLDMTVDGADEMDEALRLIKGGGGALLREKIVASASARLVIIADNSKLVETLGRYPLPVEVVPFGLTATRNLVTSLAADAGCTGQITLRLAGDGTPFVTDNGNYILDCAFGEIQDPEALDDALKLIPGVVENGLFLGLADLGIVAGPDGVTVISSAELDFEDDF
ncbi:MAG TPA: ribose-5-phosphate isomerase RpiA [Hyphomicrobium sp.]|nr:ribose-5-phosphate isomerase RpiA [Hyphomicrobium sp.]